MPDHFGNPERDGIGIYPGIPGSPEKNQNVDKKPHKRYDFAPLLLITNS